MLAEHLTKIAETRAEAHGAGQITEAGGLGVTRTTEAGQARPDY